MATNQNSGSSTKELIKRIEENKRLQKEQEEAAEKLKKLTEEIKKANEKQREEWKKINPYAIAIADMQKQAEDLTASLGDYKNLREKQLEIDKWYSTESEKLKNKKNDMSSEEYALSSMSLNSLYKSRQASALSDVWQERGEKVADIFGDELVNMLTDYENFEYDMKKVTKRLYAYIIDEAVHAMLQQIMGIKVMESMTNMLGLASTKGGFVGVASSFVKGIFGSIGKHHSGGIAPVGANAELPGTEEQLALLKGGERILSPSENTQYNSNSKNASSPVVFNNFNIKAWDSKDVQKYLLENKQLLNSITYDGIKNNSNQLRQIVRSA